MYALQLVWKTGGSVSVTGDSPGQVTSLADAKMKATPKNYVARTGVYEARLSERFPGVWNTTVPEHLKSELAPEHLKLMLDLGD